MIRRTASFFRALMAQAPALVIPFGDGEPRLVPADRVAAVTSGIITLSPFAIFLLEVRFIWERLNGGAR
jgi:hypothetical protein